ncbi:helix-hairpin-helix domain-containing protein [Candidatus Saccharibacteria bacterium]|nr:helix-hairpin-helix domain-containing protein [Candidatus Saccharibacteria bacterium]MCL1963053.1 helix-hairpin-helix domain-containing protein [Candidatus Saccharibacteria bacterium]
MTKLTEIPGIGKTIATNLARINITTVEDFANQNAQELYERWCVTAQNPSDLDRCVLYVFREAVYFANGGRDPEKLKWWNWKDAQ